MRNATTAEPLDARTARKLTPPQLARLWGISPDKVLAFIHAGELRAVNLATRRSGRPRYRIDQADVAEFERRREATPQPKRVPATRAAKGNFVTYF
jgi:excisionase family DNA binding protein